MTQTLSVDSIHEQKATATKLKLPLGAIVLSLLLGGYFLFILSFHAPAISEPDDNGYFAQGTLLARTGKTWFVPESDAQYIGMHWLITPDGAYISRYPPGLSVIIATGYLLGGYKTAMLVNPALSVLALVGFYLLLRRILATGWALCGVVLLASNPTFVHHALSGDSHMGVTCFLIWGVYLLLRWSSEARLWQVFAAGLVLGYIPTIRYPDAVVGLAVVVFILWQMKRIEGFSRHLLAAAAGAAVPMVALLIRNQLVMGAFWRTGYSLTNEQTGFSLANFGDHALGYVNQIHANGIGLLFALGLVGICCMICSNKWRALGTMLALSAIPMLLVYMAYYWAGMGPNGAGSMRFLLPTFPIYIVAGVWMLQQLTQHAPRAARVAVPVTIVAMQLLWGATNLGSQTRRLGYAKQTLALATESIAQHAAPGDVIVSSDNLLQQLDFVREWKLADASALRGGGRGMRGGGPLNRDDDADAPSPMQREKRAIQQEKYSGTFNQRFNKFADDVHEWAGSSKVWYIGPERELANTLGSDAVTIVGRVTLPDAPAMEERRVGGGRGGPGMMGPGAMGPGGGGPNRGPGQGPGQGPGPGGGGGPMRGFAGEKELVIAQWKP